MTPDCDHIGFVLEELEAAIPVFEEAGLAIGAIEEFPSEGTRELYIGQDEQAAKILLLQPLKPSGPYHRALKKRGPGLHHIAFHVAEAEAFLAANPGWLLLPQSLETWRATRTLWAARPGLGTLLEIQESEAAYEGRLVEALDVQVQDPGREALLAALRGGTTLTASSDVPTMTAAGVSMPIPRWLGL